MNFAKRIFLISVVLALFLTVAPVAFAETTATPEGPAVEGMKVSVWPEYDTPSILVIYRGRLDSSVQLPATVRVRIPKGAKVASTAAVDPSGGFVYDTAWRTHKVTSAGNDDDELSFQSSSRDWQCELYLDKISSTGQRNFDFNFQPSGTVGELLVEIQKPLRAENFKVEPAGGKVVVDERGFETSLFSFTKLDPARRLHFVVSYEKADAKPSVGKTTEAQNNNSAIIIVGFLAVVLAGLFAFWRFRVSAAGTPRRAAPVPANKRKKAASGRYCPECGAAVGKSAKFCGSCGKKI